MGIREVLILLFLVFPASGLAYTHGQICTNSGDFDFQSIASGFAPLICDGSNWKQTILLSSSGNILELDNDPSAGGHGCVQFNSTSSLLEYSHDCVLYTPMGNQWRNDGPGGGTRVFNATHSIGIGTNNPAADLHVSDIAVGGTVFLNVTNNEIRLNLNNIEFRNSNRSQLNLHKGNSTITFGGASDRPSQITFGDSNLLKILAASTTQKVGILMSTPTVELDVNGSIQYTGDVYDVSDIRYKENIKPLEHSLERVKNLQGVQFTMKRDPKQKRELGFIAQEVEEFFPEVVRTMEGKKSLHYLGLIAPMLESIKHLDRNSDDLEKNIESLRKQSQAIADRVEKIEQAARAK